MCGFVGQNFLGPSAWLMPLLPGGVQAHAGHVGGGWVTQDENLWTAIHPGWGQLGKAECGKIKAIEAGIPHEREYHVCM